MVIGALWRSENVQSKAALTIHPSPVCPGPKLVSSRVLKPTVITQMAAAPGCRVIFLGGGVVMAVREKHWSRLSGFPIFFRCNVVIHCVNSLFVFQPRGDHKLTNMHWAIFAFCWSVCGCNCFARREPQMS